MKSKQLIPFWTWFGVVGVMLILLAVTVWPAPAAADEPEPTPIAVASPQTLPPLLEALDRTIAANTLRYSMQVIASNPTSQIELYTYDGEVQGVNRHLFVGGAMTGGQRIEAFHHGDNFYYVRDGAWVFRPESSIGQVDIDPDEMLEANVEAFQKIGDEAVDGLACEVFTIDKEVGKRLVQSLGLPESWMSNVINVEVTYWVCADGYVHRARTRTDILRPDGGTNIGRVEARFFDFGAPIVVTPPPDAKPAE